MSQGIYFEIQAEDINRAMNFYGNVFGWSFVKNEFAPIDYYYIEGAPSRGGLLNPKVPKPQGPCGTNAFCCSFIVSDFDKTAQIISQNGGFEAIPKMAIPGVCWQGYFIDTEKNVFGIFEPDENAK